MFNATFNNEIDSEGRLRKKLYDKRDDFNIPIVKFPFICSNILETPAYGIYTSVSDPIFKSLYFFFFEHTVK